jgi:hypothetical protein
VYQTQRERTVRAVLREINKVKFIKIISAFLLAVAATTVLGSVAATQFILAELQKMEVAIPLAVRLKTTVHDVVGMSPAFALIVGAAFLVAFLFAALLTRFVPLPSRAWYLIGGAVAVVAALVLIKSQLGGSPVAGARGGLGLAAQGLAGLAGAWVFTKLCAEKERQQ